MLFQDTFKTLLKPAEGTFRDKGSKFIAYAIPIKAENEVKGIITDLKAEHPKARHHCWAMRLTQDRTVFKLNDDDEPSGSAGRPILNTLLSFDVTNILVVVVRYFGGTLLGIPGLINAYKTATTEALKTAEIIEKTLQDYYLLHFDYLNMNEVMRIVKENRLEIIQQDFGNSCTMQIAINKIQVNNVIEKLEKVDSIKIKYIESK
ncbi:IMPACT family protein [Rubrolithibacter danxiaensis]|uniref:IMPACT family protein n=1 Tax=Rubrolithibacter danxiaensis TaxID=3390805 RepID=UPI003BF8C2D7